MRCGGVSPHAVHEALLCLGAGTCTCAVHVGPQSTPGALVCLSSPSSRSLHDLPWADICLGLAQTVYIYTVYFFLFRVKISKCMGHAYMVWANHTYAGTCAHASTDPQVKLLKEVEQEVLANHQQALLQKEHSGAAALLRDDKVRCRLSAHTRGLKTEHAASARARAPARAMTQWGQG